MSIQTAYDAVIAEADTIEPGHGEVPSIQCGKTSDGTECVATIRVAGGTSTADGQGIPPSDSWEGALDNLLLVLQGDTASLDQSKARLRAVRQSAKADADKAAAQAEITRIDAL